MRRDCYYGFGASRSKLLTSQYTFMGQSTMESVNDRLRRGQVLCMIMCPRFFLAIRYLPKRLDRREYGCSSVRQEIPRNGNLRTSFEMWSSSHRGNTYRITPQEMLIRTVTARDNAALLGPVPPQQRANIEASRGRNARLNGPPPEIQLVSSPHDVRYPYFSKWWSRYP